jgi:hypothetical protein
MTTSNAELVSRAVVVRSTDSRAGATGPAGRYEGHRKLVDAFTRRPDGTVIPDFAGFAAELGEVYEVPRTGAGRADR